MKAPRAPARMTTARFCSPVPAATPPMMTMVSPGTMGTTESSRARARMTSGSQDVSEKSLSHVSRLSNQPERNAAYNMDCHRSADIQSIEDSTARARVAIGSSIS